MAAIGANADTSASPLDQLPIGPCNYRDLSSGQRAPVCGCRRFWVNRARSYEVAHGDDERAWCFCGHHACFHDAFAGSKTTPASIPGSVTRHQPSASKASKRPSEEVEILHAPVRDSCARPHSPRPRSPAIGLGLNNASPQHHIWDALNGYARAQAAVDSDSGPTLPSTAAPSVVEGQGLTSSHAFMHHVLQRSRPMGPPVTVPPGIANRPNEINSATEVNTPSVGSTPDLQRQHVYSGARLPPSPFPASLPTAVLRRSLEVAPHGAALPESRPFLDAEVQVMVGHPQADGRPINAVSLIELQNLVRSTAQRLDILESLSSSHVPVEEIEDKFELLDGRLLDLECWRTDQESQAHALQELSTRATKKRRLLPDEITASFNSDTSLISKSSPHSSSSAISATAAVYAEYTGRLDGIEQRLDTLEDRLPSFAQPWQVEVVLLPWGRPLSGIWMPYDISYAAGSTQGGEEWNGASSFAKSALDASKESTGGWTTDSIRAWAIDAEDWLCPKACGPSGVVYKRLQSRGLVQTISITSPDARSILQTCSDSFSHFLSQHRQTKESDASEYQGLDEVVVPLRKVRKSSRLRFLPESEMVTSATWNAAFLDASVFMKAKTGERRLYLTTPDAYIQSSGQGWSWQDVRSLSKRRSRLYNIHQANFDGEMTAQEKDCWTFHAKLDQPILDHSGTSQSSDQSRWSTKSQVSSNAKRNGDAQQTSSTAEPPISPLSEKHPSRGYRMASMPASTETGHVNANATTRRRVASFEPATVDPKRRRVSASSEHDRQSAFCTPRWSREPPSPFNSEAQGDNQSQAARRGGTPFAYATPHSNTIATIAVEQGDGDTEIDTEIIDNSVRGDEGEEEWQGVTDELRSSPDRSTKEVEKDYEESDIEDDDRDLDEGLTIYGE